MSHESQGEPGASAPKPAGVTRSSRAGRMAVGHPVDVASGTQADDFEDHLLPGRMPLVFVRHYSSAMPDDNVGMFGPGWSSPFEIYLRQDIDGYHMLAEDGESKIAFEDAEGAVESGGMVRNLGMFCELRRKSDTYVVTKWNPDSQEVVQYIFPKGADGVRWYLESKQDLTGQGIEVLRDDRRQIVRLRQRREGRGCRLAYNEQGRITEVYVTTADSERRALCYAYDAAGRLCEMTDAIGQRCAYEYDDKGRLIREINIAGMVYHLRYDAKGRCVETTGLDGYGRSTLRFEEGARFTEVFDALDNVTLYKWNESGQVEQKISPMGCVTVTVYDEHGRIVQKVEPTGAKTEYKFDERGNRVSVTSPTGAITKYEYNDCHQITCVVDPAGHRWQRAYDGAGQVESVTNPLDQSLLYRYSGLGDLVEIQDSTGRRWGLSWSSTGDLLSSTDALGHATRYEYNPEGELTAIVSARGHRTQVRLDDLGRVTEVLLPDGARRRMARNAYDQITEFVDEVGAVSRWRYAGCGLLVEEVRPHGGRIQYEWSNLPGQLLAVRNELGERYCFEYDAGGRLIKETDFAGRVTGYEYGKGNEATAIRNAAGERIALKRDAAGTLIEIAHPRGAVTKYEYDERGLLIKADNGSCPVAREYDPLRRMVREKQGEHEILSEYDSAGNRVRRQSSLGRETFFGWDANGRLVRHMPDELTPLYFQYDEEGNEIRRFVEGGVEIAHQYDDRGRRAEQRVETLTASRLERGAGGVEAIRRRDYCYDAASNLFEIFDDHLGSIRYSYDLAGRIVTAMLPYGYSERFTYDVADNLTTHVQGDVARHLAYGAGNTLARRDGVVYEYNALGQLVRKATDKEETTYSWGAQGALAKVKLPDGAEWTYHYDGLGRRVEKHGSTERVEFVWDGDVVLHEVRYKRRAKPEVVDWEFSQDSFAPIGKSERGVRYLCVNDVIGVPQEVVTKDGGIAWEATFSALGELLSSNVIETDCPIRFQGQWCDNETGLHYNRFRYYEPVSSRYIDTDPAGFIGGLNSYKFAGIGFKWIDPYGLAPTKNPRVCIGPKWKARDINDTVCERGCERVAKQIQKKIGGNVVRITPDDAPVLGGFRGKNWGWSHHEVVVKDGRVFDLTTGHQGLPTAEYKQLWQYPSGINFGF